MRARLACSSLARDVGDCLVFRDDWRQFHSAVDFPQKEVHVIFQVFEVVWCEFLRICHDDIASVESESFENYSIVTVVSDANSLFDLISIATISRAASPRKVMNGRCGAFYPVISVCTLAFNS